MTTQRPDPSRTALALQALSVLLLALGLGVVPAEAQEGPGRIRSESAGAARTRVRSPSVTRSRAQHRRSAHNTRQFHHSRSRSDHHRGHHGHHHPLRSYLNFHFGYGGHHYPYSYYGSYWGPYYYPPVYAGYGRPHYANRYLGALDLNVKPKKAEVYLDGEHIGLAKDFDGFPGFLWLEKGTYEISFYLPGYRTLTRSLTVYPGSGVDVRLRLEPGEAVLPEKPLRPRARAADRPPARWRDRDDDDDRGERDRELRREVEKETERDIRSEPGRLRLRIAPEDATVYLDGRFLGSGEELGRLHAGLIVEPGDHLLEVVRPGFESRRLEVRVGEGEEVELSVELTEGPPSA
ncbi:MAG: PEGA domain-containing protein [Thermoanaerobaculia bacterium]